MTKRERQYHDKVKWRLYLGNRKVGGCTVDVPDPQTLNFCGYELKIHPLKIIDEDNVLKGRAFFVQYDQAGNDVTITEIKKD